MTMMINKLNFTILKLLKSIKTKKIKEKIIYKIGKNLKFLKYKYISIITNKYIVNINKNTK